MPKNDNTLAILTHILGIFAWFIPSLVIYLVTEDKYSKQHAKNALNWQISAAIYFLVSMILVIIIVGVFLAIAVYVLNIVFSIMATVKASEGKIWEYPLTIRFIK